MSTDNIIPFPRRHKGDPEPCRFALVMIGFHWRGGRWRRGRVVLTDADIDAMAAPVWEQALRRWTTRCPRADRSRLIKISKKRRGEFPLKPPHKRPPSERSTAGNAVDLPHLMDNPMGCPQGPQLRVFVLSDKRPGWKVSSPLISRLFGLP
jgi:hypothetical protein